MQLRDTSDNLYPIFCSGPKDLGVHGPGLMLYFLFIKWMGFGFAIMSLLSIPAFYSNIIGDGITGDEQVSVLDQTTVGNQDDIWTSNTSADSTIESTNRLERYMVIYSDIAYTIFFVIWLTLFKIVA